MAEQFANNAQSTLNGAVNNSVTTIVVADGSVFPATGDFRIKIDSELMLCTARSVNSLTVTRGIEGTSAAAHSDLAAVKHILTKASIFKLFEDMSLTGTFASRPAAGVVGRMFYPTDTPWITHSRDTGSAWVNFFNGVQLSTPPASGNWSVNTAGNVTFSHEKDAIKALCSGSTPSVVAFYEYGPALTAPYKITVGVWVNHGRTAAAYHNMITSFPMLQSSDNKNIYTEIMAENNDLRLSRSQFTNLTTLSTNQINRDYFSLKFPMYLQFEDDNTNRHMRVSLDGINFGLIWTDARNNFCIADTFLWGLFGCNTVAHLFHMKIE